MKLSELIEKLTYAQHTYGDGQVKLAAYISRDDGEDYYFSTNKITTSTDVGEEITHTISN